MSSERKLCFWRPRDFQTMSLLPDWIRRAKLSANGGRDTLKKNLRACKSVPGKGGQSLFPPCVRMEVKAIACELPYESGIPLSRFSISEIHREVINRGIIAEISGTTIWRWLHADAIRPWQYRSWIFPRDPDFEEKAGRVLDLYEGYWEGIPLGPRDFVLSADEKTSIQARLRRHRTMGPQPGTPTKVEHEYRRGGAFNYLAAWDVHRAKIFGRVESQKGIDAFTRLVDQVMSQEPYGSASRVFWIVDNGPCHRGTRAAERLQEKWPNARMVHLPVHASWLNQIEIFLSIVQRKVLTPNDSASTGELEERLLGFQKHYQEVARPFQWKFTRKDLANLMHKLVDEPCQFKQAA